VVTSHQQPHGRKDFLLRRSAVFPIPPAGFDPEKATEPELEKFGIIPRPDQGSDLFDNWRRLFKAPVTFVNPARIEVKALFQLNPAPVISPIPVTGAGSRLSHSGNWSGGYIVPVHDTMVVQVAAEWTLHTLSLPPPVFIEPNATDYVCSTWVGLDGQGRYLNASLPQIGVMQTLPAPPSTLAPSATAFCQWWDREGGGTFLSLTGLPVAAGDTVIGSVWADTATTVICYLRNVSTSTLAVVGMTAPSVTPHGGAPLQLTISGATAEWILERPTIFGSTRLYPFPKYQTTEFDAWAAVARDAGPPQAPHDLRTARHIAMFDTLDAPARTAFISMPHQKGNSAIAVEYGGFEPK